MNSQAGSPSRKVAGTCPMGCGETLFLGAGGHVTCSALTCANPCAVDEILTRGELGHIVRVDEFNYALKHPLAERIKDDLFDCDLNRYLGSLPGSPVSPGFYHVTGSGTTWAWEFLKEY